VRFLFDHDVPDDFSYLMEQLGHEVLFLRKAIPVDSSYTRTAPRFCEATPFGLVYPLRFLICNNCLGDAFSLPKAAHGGPRPSCPAFSHVEATEIYWVGMNGNP
jgi:hypothetical protein